MSIDSSAVSDFKQFFAQLGHYVTIEPDLIDSLEQVLEIKRIRPDAYICEAYENEKKIGFMLDGIIRVYHLDEKGKEFNKNFFIKNDFFMTSLGQEINSSIFLQSLTESQVILIDYDEYMKLALKYTVLEDAINQILLDYMTKKQQREIELLSLSAKERYIKFTSQNPILTNKLPQLHIASYLGITPTQLSRIKKTL